MDKYLYYARKAWESEQRGDWPVAASHWLTASKYSVCEWDREWAELKSKWCSEQSFEEPEN